MDAKETFQFEIMKQIILGMGGALEKLALKFDFSKVQFDKLITVLDYYQFDKPDFSYDEFDSRMEKELNLSYQDVKIVFLSLYEEELYIEVIRQYLKTNARTFDNVSLEYTTIFRELFPDGIE
jgi:hypothetical protein